MSVVEADFEIGLNWLKNVENNDIIAIGLQECLKKV